MPKLIFASAIMVLALMSAPALGGRADAPGSVAPETGAAETSAAAGKCYNLNKCRGNYTPSVKSAEECARQGGVSWMSPQGQCLADLSED